MVKVKSACICRVLDNTGDIRGVVQGVKYKKMEVSAEGDSHGGEEDSILSGTEEYETAIEQESDVIGGQHVGLSELAPDDMQESVAGEVGPNDIFTASTIRELAMAEPRKREGDHRPVNSSAELQSPEGLESFRNSQFVSVTEAPYEGQSQSASADQGSISPYSVGEVTQSSSTAAPLETRFMHVWNLFDTERKGEVETPFPVCFMIISTHDHS